MKRLVDVLGALVGIVVTAPVWVVAAAAIRLEDGGEVLYRSARAGKDGAEFTLYKFRTMRTGSGPRVTSSADERITRAGRFLRDWKIDELPQLWNVLRGDMSLVGPRPEDPRYVAGYTPEQRRVLSVRPGITGPAAIAYRSEEEMLAGYQDPEASYVTEVLPAKLLIDLEYVDTRSMLGDLVLLVRTLVSVFRR